jgi:hypothetical protein
VSADADGAAAMWTALLGTAVTYVTVATIFWRRDTAGILSGIGEETARATSQLRAHGEAPGAMGRIDGRQNNC